jgi:hypothetical protein
MSETVREWKNRKMGQAMRLANLHPGWMFDTNGDYGTKFVMLNQVVPHAIVFGQLPWNGRMQPSIDLTDEEVTKIILDDDGRV